MPIIERGIIMTNQNENQKKLEELKQYVRSIGDARQLLDYLGDIHPSDAYLINRDILTNAQKKLLSQNVDEKIRSEYNELRYRMKVSWDHDHTTATMKDIDRAVTNAYHITLKMIKQINDDQTRIKEHINAMRVHMGLSEIDWLGDNDGEKQDNEQPPEVSDNVQNE